MTKSLTLLALSATLIIIMSACQDNVSPNLEESLDLFAGLEAITEAQNTNVTINRGTAATDGYFTIQIDNVDETPLLAPGVHEAWCLEWNKNLRSNGDVHQEVKWFSTGDNDTWKPLNYLFSIRGELQAENPNLTFRDLQAVVWVLAGEMGIAPTFDVLNMPVSQIPSRLRDGDELAIDPVKVAGIARRVMEEAPEAIGVPSGTVAQTAEDEQDIYTPPASLFTDVVIDETVRTITLFVDAGIGNTLTSFDFDLGGLTNEITDGGIGAQTATIVLTSDGNATYSYLVTVTNDKGNESTESATDQPWPLITVCNAPVLTVENDNSTRTITLSINTGSDATISEVNFGVLNNLQVETAPGSFTSVNGNIWTSSTPQSQAQFTLVNADPSNDSYQYFVEVTNSCGETAIIDESGQWPPVSQRVAFTSNRDGNNEIYVIDADGSNIIRLTSNAAEDALPSMSADGQRVAFASVRNGNTDIYMVNTDGSNLTRLTVDAGNDAQPSISADGQRIAFASFRDGNIDIYVVDADGSNLTRLTTNAATDIDPSISADGQRVAFRSTRDGNSEIYVVDADGSNLTRLTTNVERDAEPSISADGQRVAFRSSRDGNVEIYVVNADGSNLTNLSTNAAGDDSPSISADGQRVAFISRRDGGNNEIYVVDADGSNLTRLTDNPFSDFEPSISADGQRVAFISERDGNQEIYVVDTDGSNLTRLTDNPAPDSQPSISGN